MNPRLLALLKELADVLERHQGGLFYTTIDDGVHVSVGNYWEEDGASVCIGWPENGNVSEIHKIIDYYSDNQSNNNNNNKTK
jgi:hypothetical protein